MAEERKKSTGASAPGTDLVTPGRTPPGSTRGSLIDYESQKIKRVVLSTTVAELYALTKCFGTTLFLRGLWMDMSGEQVPILIRTDANNLVSTAATTRLPEQKETIHMIEQLRREACSGQIDDLAHVRTAFCLSDALTKAMNPDVLVQAVETGILPAVDMDLPFRDKLQHKAFAVAEQNPKDWWSLQGRRLIRYHAMPRSILHVPSQLPPGIVSVAPWRLTTATMTDGKQYMIKDTWRRRPVRLESMWVGTTEYWVQEGSVLQGTD